MFVSQDGPPERCVFVDSSEYDVHDDSTLQEGWLAQLMASREVAACVVEVMREQDELDYRFVSVSPAFAHATGMHDAVGRSMRELRPDHEQFWFELYARVSHSGEPVDFEHAARALDRRFHGHAFRIGSPGAWRVVVLFENSGQHAGNLGLVPEGEGKARLERFGATLAHELRGPLAALYNGLHIVKQGAMHSTETQWALAMMERQFARMSALIDDLLDVGRLDASNVRVGREHVSVHHVVSECIEACTAAIDARGHAVVIESDDRPLMVRGDLRRLTQVFTNLLTNSIKYTPPGGHIRIGLDQADGHAVIEVRDDGAGIADDELPHVFDYFTQGRSHQYQASGGLGVGLFIVRNIVRLHGGTVTATSDGPGRGSAFTVRLPLSSSV
jgi:signal transduction histidine kinase